MTVNPALKKPLACISHPFSIGAILLLFLNDHLLRLLWPSWWTGKLGDFAWLFFFPFIVAALLACLLPKGLTQNSRWVGGLAFALVGSVFLLAKTMPSFQAGLIAILESVSGFSIRVQTDPTDLVALPSLVAGAWLWTRVKILPESRFRPGLALLATGVLLTIANMAQPDPGIKCVGKINEEIVACSSYNCYSSSDGGLSWGLREGENPLICPDSTGEAVKSGEKVKVPAQPGVTYRFSPGGDIQRSEDAGLSWKVEYQVVPVSQAQKSYYFKTHSGNPTLLDSPQAGIYDPTSGNVIFTMGHEGVLVRQAQGEYKLFQVGPYGQVKTTQFDVLMVILSGEFALAACFGGLVAVVLGLYEERSTLKKVVGIMSLVVWLFPVFFVPPALTAGTYGAMLSTISMLVAGLLILPLVVDGFFMVGILAPDSLLRLGQLVITGMLLFLMPYILWGINLLPDYRLATLGGVLLGGGFLLFQYRALMIGTSSVRPEVPSQVEPKSLKKAGWLFLVGAVLAVGGIGMFLFGLGIGIVISVLGLVLMLSGAWVRRKVWFAARADVANQENTDQEK